MKEFLKKKGGRFAFDARVSGDDDLNDLVVCDASKKFFDVEFIGGNAVNWGDGAAEDMVSAFVRFGSFDAVNVEGFFYDKNRSLVARRVGVKRRDGFAAINECKSFRAGFDARMERFKCVNNRVGDLRIGTKQKVGITLCCARTDARQVTERLDGVR